MDREKQHQERIEQFLREGRTVSGGFNPPDRYDAVPLTGNVANDLAAINAKADEGYRFVAVVENFVLMGSYKKEAA